MPPTAHQFRYVYRDRDGADLHPETLTVTGTSLSHALQRLAAELPPSAAELSIWSVERRWKTLRIKK